MQFDYLSRFNLKPVLVRPESMTSVVASLRTLAAKGGPRMDSDNEDFWHDSFKGIRPYQVKNKILIIPVKGVLLNDFPFAFGNFATGYEYILQAFRRGMSDPEVSGIVFSVDSNGGEVAGCFDAIDEMYAAKGVKPIKAVVTDSCFSAAYAVSSVADSITVSKTGGAGSVGVVTSHIDLSASLEQEGVKVTLIFAGDHKVDGNPYEPLPDGVKKDIQAHINELYDVFVATVARNRNMDEAAVRATEARAYSASEALAKGLIDKVAPARESMAVFTAELSTNKGVLTMSNTQDNAATDVAALESAAHARGLAEGSTQGKALGSAEEKARIKDILTSDEAQGRTESAVNIALGTSLSVDEAKALLHTLPMVEASSPRKPEGASAFEKAMAVGNPEISPVAESSQNVADDAGEILASFSKASGRKFLN